MTQEQKNIVLYVLACLGRYQSAQTKEARTHYKDQLAAAKAEFEQLGGTWGQIVYEVEAEYKVNVAKDWQE